MNEGFYKDFLTSILSPLILKIVLEVRSLNRSDRGPNNSNRVLGPMILESYLGPCISGF